MIYYIPIILNLKLIKFLCSNSVMRQPKTQDTKPPRPTLYMGVDLKALEKKGPLGAHLLKVGS